MLKNKFLFIFAIAIISSPALAGPNSILGGKQMSEDSAHHVGVGWPSVFYEYWRSGSNDLGIGGEIVYGDWSGEFSDVEIGLAFNLPMKWHIQNNGRTDIGFRFTPGAMIASFGGPPGGDLFGFAARGELAVPISIEVDPKVNIITGGTAPVAIYIIEDIDPFFVLPVLARIGAEFEAKPNIIPYLLLELGPAFAFGDFGTEAEFAFRVWLGTTFW